MKISYIVSVMIIMLFFLPGCGSKTALVAPDILPKKKEKVDQSSLTSEKRGILLD